MSRINEWWIKIRKQEIANKWANELNGQFRKEVQTQIKQGVGSVPLVIKEAQTHSSQNGSHQETKQ